MASNHSSPFAIQLSPRGGGGGHNYEEVDQDFEAQDVLRGANNTSNLRSRNNYQRDKHSDEIDISNDFNSSDDDDDDSEDHESAQRRRRKYMNTSIGDLYQRNNSRHNNNNSSLSFNLILICLLGFLTIFGLGYYALGKREQREMHANEVQEQKELERLKVKYGLVESDKKTVEGDKKANSIQHQVENKSTADNSEKKQQQQHETISSSSKQAQSHLPEHFDPFHLHTNQDHNQQINSHTNDWFGAPFVVSPPQLPSFIANGGNENADGTSSHSGSRLGYFQYPTIFNSTLVFSSEGDLYLTRVPTTINTDTMTYASMPAMKLTTTVGNTIHPRLNHKYPHLLAYSATYSGDREVYLMDLRSITTSSSIKVPGTPGGPALRLTYTTGGINSVVGWDEDGTSILYSAHGDQVGMPDVRLYRLRLSSLGGAVREAGINSTIGAGDEVSIPKVVHSDDTEHTLDDNSGHKYISPVNANEKTNQTKNKKKNNNDAKNRDDQQRKLNREKERQHRHAAKLLLSSQSRRGLVGSNIHPILEPVPLSEAVEGVYHTTSAASNTECIYFTRVKQSSNTKRYVGGTAENLWSYCPGEFNDLAIPLTADYNGTSKSPIVYSHGGHGDWLFFMSDRAVDSSGSIGGANQTSGWAASSMDLWAAPLPVTLSGFSSTPTRLTNVACQYNGMELMEIAVDQSNGAVVLRIGADLHYMSMEAIEEKLYSSKKALGETQIQQLPIAVYSDFSSMQERIIPLRVSKNTIFDAYATSYGVSALISSRGQTYVAPVIPDGKLDGNYGGGGLNMPSRRYKVAPGTGGGGMVRILCAKNIPHSTGNDSDERFALVLATDPLSPTGEHAFYIIRTDAMASPSFGFSSLYETDTMEETGLPVPFIGGHLESGGSTKDGGLGSIHAETVTVSPCGRRFSYANTDGQLIVVTVPIDYKGNNRQGRHLASVDKVVLPWENEQSQPLYRDTNLVQLVFSPGGRYLAIEHTARNAFKVISIADLGATAVGSLQLGRIVQVTPDRFNSFSVVWGRESKDFAVDEHASKLQPSKTDSASHGGATALFFLSDRDINLEGDTNPWGTRAPAPRFDGHSCVHVLPLRSLKDSIEANEVNAFIRASFGGGGASEVLARGMKKLDLMLKGINAASEDIGSSNTTSEEQPYVMDTPISFEKENEATFKFARTSYRLDSIPAGKYVKIVCQLSDDPSLVIATNKDQKYDDLELSLLAIIDYPSDRINEVSLYDGGIEVVDMSTDGAYVLILVSGEVQAVPRTVAKFNYLASDKNIAATDGLHVSVWPALEYQQMYADSWRLFRDYFYDAELHQIEWDEVFDRYLPLVERCGKREELDDVMRQMGGELSALHVFVMYGEYDGHASFTANEIAIASLGVTLRRSTEMNGYEIVEIPESDPDFHMRDRQPMYSPLSEQVLRLSGQQALEPGDIIIGVNGEHVMNVPSINMLLRGKAGESVRLEVQRVTSKSKVTELRRAKMRLLKGNDDDEDIPATEPLVVVPLSSYERDELIYAAWEWKTRERAKILAAESGFTLGYVHLQDMSGAPATNAFARGFYPDHDKQALIVDVRHNAGGNIHSWLLDILQRKAWMYWQFRGDTDGGLMWDEHFAFRGHLVVLIDEKTGSDGEIFARGVSELGLGKIVGKRSWGGSIGLKFDNNLVDGGIATAPEIGVYNDKYGWGMGIEQMGVVPDVEVDNNPRDAYEGEDTQLEVAISVLKEWLKNEEVVLPKNPGRPKNMSKKRKDSEGCLV